MVPRLKQNRVTGHGIPEDWEWWLTAGAPLHEAGDQPRGGCMWAHLHSSRPAAPPVASCLGWGLFKLFLSLFPHLRMG